MAGAGRNRTVDGIRGCLAVVVLASHVLQSHGSNALFGPASSAVAIIFALSACVLVRSWNGRYLEFLARRFVRLWPMYALGLAAGYLLLGAEPSPALFFWIPVSTAGNAPVADPPAWSLTIEAWGMLAMPAFVWVGRGSSGRLAIAMVGTIVAGEVNPDAFFGWFFFLGAWASRFELRWRVFEMPIPQWLGRISYPLYLIHVPILWYAHLPLIISIPLAFVAAAVLTETVEKWSIKASRAVCLTVRHTVAAQEGFAL